MTLWAVLLCVSVQFIVSRGWQSQVDIVLQQQFLQYQFVSFVLPNSFVFVPESSVCICLCMFIVIVNFHFKTDMHAFE